MNKTSKRRNGRKGTRDQGIKGAREEGIRAAGASPRTEGGRKETREEGNEGSRDQGSEGRRDIGTKVPEPHDVIVNVSLSVPLAPLKPGAYEPLHIEARLSRQQGAVLKQLYWASRITPLHLAGGKIAQTNADLIRWLLEQIAEAAEEGRDQGIKGSREQGSEGARDKG